MFLNTECLIQIAPGTAPEKDQHWYCDIVAASFHDRTAYLCEITYSKSMQSLVTRLKAWQEHWPGILEALRRDSEIPTDWKVRPWIFIPEGHIAVWNKKFVPGGAIGATSLTMPAPLVTALEKVVPWGGHRTWDRRDEDGGPVG